MEDKIKNEEQEVIENVCNDCGTVNLEDSKFCTECGASLEQINEDLAKENICSNCGSINLEDAKFCKDCGGNLKESSSNPGNQSLNDLINNRHITQRKGLGHKLFSDAGKAFIKAKGDIEKSIQDYTLAVEASINETDDSLIVSVELPSIKKEDLDVNITPRMIKLKADFEHEIEIEQGTQIRRKELQKGQFNKNIILPKEVIPESAQAEFKNNLLIIKLPKLELEEGHKLKF